MHDKRKNTPHNSKPLTPILPAAGVAQSCAVVDQVAADLGCTVPHHLGSCGIMDHHLLKKWGEHVVLDGFVFFSGKFRDVFGVFIVFSLAEQPIF